MMVAENVEAIWGTLFDYPEYSAYHLAIRAGDHQSALALNRVLTIRAIVDWNNSCGETKRMREQQVGALKSAARSLKDKIVSQYGTRQ